MSHFCLCAFVQVLPIIDLVRGIPCAVTKRRHLRKALLQYLDEFDSCKCAPCPNNGKPVLSGTECKCLCQTGTYGTNCEKRAPDFTSGICSTHQGRQQKRTVFCSDWSHCFVSHDDFPFPIAHLLDDLTILLILYTYCLFVVLPMLML